MSEISNSVEIIEKNEFELEKYRDIKSEEKMSISESRDFWDYMFDYKRNDLYEPIENDNTEKMIEKLLGEYFEDLRNNSECPETIFEKPFDISDLKKITPEENAKMREEFDEKKPN